MIRKVPEAEYLSVAHVSMFADASQKTVRRWLKLPDDPLPAVRLGAGPHARIRIARRELLAWLERRRAVPPLRSLVDEIVERARAAGDSAP
jgi:hypothetical protein